MLISVRRNSILGAFSLTLLFGVWPSPASSQTAVFQTTTSLQSIAVQVVDKKGNFVPGLTASDFTLLEDGRPQKIAFFGADQQPASVAILLDSSSSMDFGRKFDRARELLAGLFAGHHANDEIFFVPFTERIETFQPLTPEQRQHPASIQVSRGTGDRGTAFYDALSSALCHLRTAENPRQAVVVITDGADQHSRLNLEQLIELAQMSNPQIFTIGLFSRTESQVFHQGRKTVTLLGEREIDNPVLVFERLAKESGAESFFPTSEQDLKAALERIANVIDAQYTLAYYPERVDRFRKIEVRVRRSGAKVIARRGVGSESGIEPVHFRASTCEVSAEDHPYPWEPKSTHTISGDLVYQEDFADPKSGWPNRGEHLPARPASRGDLPFGDSQYRPGLRYVPGGYEISRKPPRDLVTTGPIVEGVVAAYGLSWDNFRASVSVEADWTRQRGDFFEIMAGLVFHLSSAGYYILDLSGGVEKGSARRIIQFKLVRTLFNDDGPGQDTDLIPWTPIAAAAVDVNAVNTASDWHAISVEYRAGQIAVLMDERPVASIHDDRLPSGLIGMGLFGHGNAVFRDLFAQELR